MTIAAEAAPTLSQWAMRGHFSLTTHMDGPLNLKWVSFGHNENCRIGFTRLSICCIILIIRSYQ